MLCINLNAFGCPLFSTSIPSMSVGNRPIAQEEREERKKEEEKVEGSWERKKKERRRTDRRIKFIYESQVKVSLRSVLMKFNAQYKPLTLHRRTKNPALNKGGIQDSIFPLPCNRKIKPAVIFHLIQGNFTPAPFSVSNNCITREKHWLFFLLLFFSF